MIDINKKLEIKYPCEWNYKIIGNKYELIVDAIEDILLKNNEKKYKVELSKKSKSSKYVSVNLNIIVVDEATRLKYFKKLSQNKNINIVI